MTDSDSKELEIVLFELENDADVKPDEIVVAKEVIAKPSAIDLPIFLLEDPLPPQDPKPVIAASRPTVNLEDESAKDIRAQIAEMTMPQKIKLALFGNAVSRGILILDPGRMIQQFVLKNPKLSLNEVEAIARNPNVSDFVLRCIAESKTWMRGYSLKLSIVMNPRTPGDVALKWLRYLQEGDLRRVAASKNIPQLVATTAKKRLMDLKK